MDSEQAQLVSSGAEALIEAMAVVEAAQWALTRNAATTALTPVGQDPTAIARELDAHRADLTGDPALADDLQATWRLRIRRALQTDENTAERLRAFITQHAPTSAPGTGSGAVSGNYFAGPVAFQTGANSTQTNNFGPR